jgi:hypothetical protein
MLSPERIVIAVARTCRSDDAAVENILDGSDMLAFHAEGLSAACDMPANGRPRV